MIEYNHKKKGANNMEKTITTTVLNAAIEAACNNLRNNLGWSDEECVTFAANLMENLDKDGWKIVEG